MTCVTNAANKDTRANGLRTAPTYLPQLSSYGLRGGVDSALVTDVSANSFFLGGTDLNDITLARADERDALSTYGSLIDEVRSRCGAEVASLFAEPVRGANRTTGMANVAWYSPYEGTAFPLRQVDGAARGPVIELLRQRLLGFSSLFSDSRHGAVFASWLHVLSADSVMAVAGQPVIRNWGMLPNAVATSADAREGHFRNGLGQYLPPVPAPPFSAAEAQSFAAAMGRHAEREVARSAPPPGVVVPPSAPPPRPTGRRRPWLAPAIATGAAAAVFAVLAFGHVLRYPRLATEPTAAVEAQRDTNKALRERLATLRGALPNACRAEDGAPGTPMLPPSPERTKVQTRDPATRQPETSTLGALLDKATVLVILENSLGSGFFVSDRHIVTNHHVVGNAREVQVASRALGGLVPARVVAVGTGADRGTQDVAVLEIDPKPGTAALSVGVAPGRLDAVTASGYPGAVLETIAMNRGAALPEANFTQGIVTSHQVQQPAGIETIIHTAQIGHGNSGGPLVDTGGCAVGVNSWLSPDAMGDVIFSTYFQALDASELRRFLTAHSIAFTASDTSCHATAASPDAKGPAPQPARAP